MTTIAIDTHKLIRSLKSSGLSEEQAEGITDAIREAHASSDVATRGDMREFELRLDSRFKEVDAELKLLKWMMGTTLAVATAVLVRLFIH